MLDHYEYFKSEVYKMTNIDLNCYKEKQMRRRIDTLAKKHKADSYEEYIGLLKNNTTLFEQFVNFLTINVSEFYRNMDQWNKLDESIIPDMIERRGDQLKIWSAACSTGDEPYSLVMAFSKYLPLSKIHVLATDIDKQVIEQAKNGLYNEKSIAAVPANLKLKYFKQVGKSFQIAEEVKKCVTFQEHNLLRDPYPEGYDLILCRNVVIYFTDEAKAEIYRKFYQTLNPQGVLFIGSTEQITNYKEIGFQRLSSFFFQKTS
jgi:chemotaxis protein methyltransferase CheR